jgi:hypothetical protein
MASYFIASRVFFAAFVFSKLRSMGRAGAEVLPRALGG